MAATKFKKYKESSGQVLRKKLALATCTLLSQGVSAQEERENWVLDTSLLSYQEREDRIEVNKLILNAQSNIGDTAQLAFDFVYDTMTGSTPTGAIPIRVGGAPSSGDSQPVVITSPSGDADVLITGQAGIPRDVVQTAAFEDERIGLNVNWLQKHTRALQLSYGLSYSDENDYTSTGFSVQAEINDELKLNTYTVGVAYTDDEISRVGGNLKTPLSSIQINQDYISSESRDSLDLIFGYVRVLNRTTLFQINMTFGNSDGYHTDPYKNISVLDGTGMEVDRLYERRPDSRQRNTILSQLVHHLDRGDEVRVSYRYYTDDWGINAHTIESSYRHNFEDGRYIEPGVRFYSQNEADFYHRSLTQNDPVPLHASSDARLAEMSGQSISIKFGFPLRSGDSFRIRLESYDQSFTDAVIDGNKAIIFQMSYRTSF